MSVTEHRPLLPAGALRTALVGGTSMVLLLALCWCGVTTPATGLRHVGRHRALRERSEQLQRQVGQLGAQHDSSLETLAGLRSRFASLWVLPEGAKAAQELEAEVGRVCRRAQVGEYQLTNVRSVPQTLGSAGQDQVVPWELTLRMRSSMRELTRLLVVVAQSDCAWCWGDVSIAPENTRAPGQVVFSGVLQARVLSPEVSHALAALAAAAPAAKAADRAPLPGADVLWQRSLFRPERSESPDAKPVEPAAESPFQFELVGLASLKGQKAAVILCKSRSGVRRPVPPGGAAAAPRRVPARGVYQIEDQIGDTGYVLKEIRLAGADRESEVVLSRGTEELVLRMAASDVESASRREEARKLALARQAAAAAVAAAPATPGAAPAPATTAAPPPPPPPPAASAAAGGTPTAAAGESSIPLSREERLERARALRERILQQRAAGESEN